MQARQQIYDFIQGTTPLLISIPHSGTYVPEYISARFTSSALQLPDTDWYVNRLYEFAEKLGANILIANYSRYVIDLNRPPDNKPLYPTKNTPDLCPLKSFNGSSIYKSGDEPDENEVEQRKNNYWLPYHQHLQKQLNALRNKYGVAVLFDAHSIPSEVPLLFSGKLHDLNLGTSNGKTIDIALENSLFDICKNAKTYTSILNGRFLGGYITRHYGNPEKSIHAVQLELTQKTYMQEQSPYTFEVAQAVQIQQVLKKLLVTILSWANNTSH